MSGRYYRSSIKLMPRSLHIRRRPCQRIGFSPSTRLQNYCACRRTGFIVANAGKPSPLPWSYPHAKSGIPSQDSYSGWRGNVAGRVFKRGATYHIAFSYKGVEYRKSALTAKKREADNLLAFYLGQCARGEFQGFGDPQSLTLFEMLDDFIE